MHSEGISSLKLKIMAKGDTPLTKALLTTPQKNDGRTKLIPCQKIDPSDLLSTLSPPRKQDQTRMLRDANYLLAIPAI